MGNSTKLRLDPNDEFLIHFEKFIENEKKIKKIIKLLLLKAENLNLETYNEYYISIEEYEKELKKSFSMMEKDIYKEKFNSKEKEEYKKKKLVLIKKKFMNLIEEYMKLPLKIFSTIKVSIK